MAIDLPEPKLSFSPEDLNNIMRHAIEHDILPEALRLFLEKNAAYGTITTLFGAKGEVIEVHRKTGKLYRQVWQDIPDSFEGIEEVAMDMIGHLLMLIWHHRREVLERTDYLGG